MKNIFRYTILVDTKRTPSLFYPVTMVTGLRVAVVGLLCLYSADGEGAVQKETKPISLVTDGTRNLTLTCPDAEDPKATYAWFTPGSDTKRCVTTSSGKECTFQPRLEDDNMNVTCRVFGENGDFLFLAPYQLNLTYPPQSRPKISREPPQRNAERYTVTCTVSGGKPPVANITFHCEKAEAADQTDVVTDDGLGLSNSLTVNVTKATQVNVSCSCSAYWAPEPGLYTSRETFNDTITFSGDMNKQPPFIASGPGVAAMAFVAMFVI